jgi:hypothetical protein
MGNGAIAMNTSDLFGASDQVPCTICGEAMMVTRRAPHPLAAGHEQQKLTCYACNGQAERAVDRDGNVLAQ